jgi:hypothetical protein
MVSTAEDATADGPFRGETARLASLIEGCFARTELRGNPYFTGLDYCKPLDWK